MKVKYWALVGVLYVAVVIAGYTAITGENPLESTDMHDDHEAALIQIEEDQYV